MFAEISTDLSRIGCCERQYDRMITHFHRRNLDTRWPQSLGLAESKLEHYHFEAFVSKVDIFAAILKCLDVFKTRADGKGKSLAVTAEDGNQAELKRKEGNSGSLT